MKKFLLIIPAIALIIYAVAANRPATISKDGIIFFEGSWADALKKSEAEHKPIFVDVSTSWCGWCKKLKRNAFSDKEIGTFFNSNFINVAIDAEKGEGPRLAQKYGVNGFPTLLVVDKNEDVIIYSSGYMESDALMQLGKKALKKYN